MTGKHGAPFKPCSKLCFVPCGRDLERTPTVKCHVSVRDLVTREVFYDSQLKKRFFLHK